MNIKIVIILFQLNKQKNSTTLVAKNISVVTSECDHLYYAKVTVISG